MNPIRAKLVCISLLISWTIVGFALPNDKDQVMHVSADSANLSQQDHKGVYSGHVEFVQGTTNLHAAHAITQGNEKNQLSLAIAKGENGQQAHYWTQNDPNKPPFHAYADTIRYYPLRHLVELVGNARIEQGKNSLSAARITYDTVAQHLVSSSQGPTRTIITFYPEEKK